jgi:WD40 repeat protein
MKTLVKQIMILQFLLCTFFIPDLAGADDLVIYRVQAAGSVVVAATNQGIYVWQGDINATPIILPELDIYTLALDPSANRLAIGDKDHNISVWGLSPLEKIIYPTNSDDPIIALEWDLDGSSLLYMNRFAGPTTVNADTFTFEFYLPGGGHDFQLSPDGKFIALVDFGVIIFNLENGERSTFDSNQGQLLGLSWSQDGQYLASTGFNGELKVWNFAQQLEVFSLTVSPNLPIAVEFSPASNLLAVKGDGDILVVDFESGEILHSIPSPRGGFTWSPDGESIIYIDPVQKKPIFVQVNGSSNPSPSFTPTPDD